MFYIWQVTYRHNYYLLNNTNYTPTIYLIYAKRTTISLGNLNKKSLSLSLRKPFYSKIKIMPSDKTTKQTILESQIFVPKESAGGANLLTLQPNCHTYQLELV